MSKALLALAAIFLTAGQPDWSPAFDETVDPQSFGSVEIAPVEQALTFARHDVTSLAGPPEMFITGDVRTQMQFRLSVSGGRVKPFVVAGKVSSRFLQ